VAAQEGGRKPQGAAAHGAAAAKKFIGHAAARVRATGAVTPAADGPDAAVVRCCWRGIHPRVPTRRQGSGGGVLGVRDVTGALASVDVTGEPVPSRRRVRRTRAVRWGG
jgi:hypothetical protein